MDVVGGSGSPSLLPPTLHEISLGVQQYSVMAGGCRVLCQHYTCSEIPTASQLEANNDFVCVQEHCLMGIKGSVRRSSDGHIIHSNIDTDVIITEEPPFGSTQKPDELYHIIEHFALGGWKQSMFELGRIVSGSRGSAVEGASVICCCCYQPSPAMWWHGAGGCAVSQLCRHSTLV